MDVVQFNQHDYTKEGIGKVFAEWIYKEKENSKKYWLNQNMY